jgi:hypothetical protein
LFQLTINLFGYNFCGVNHVLIFLYESLFGEKTILKFNIRIVDSKENPSNSLSVKKKISFSTAELKQTLIKLNRSIALIFANSCLDSNISFANVREISQETRL